MCTLFDDLVSIVRKLWRSGIRIPFYIARDHLYASAGLSESSAVWTYMLGDKGWERSDVSENALSIHGADYSIDLA